MERLPYIDDHARPIGAPADRIWSALVHVMGRTTDLHLPGAVVKTWGIEHTGRRGDWNEDVTVGDSVFAFIVTAADSRRSLTLRGSHRFSTYELRFDLEPLAPGETLLRATTSAAFPGVSGRVYRALVIGSRGHVIAVRRILAAVARRAESAKERSRNRPQARRRPVGAE
jgi:hypothetical protein